MTGVRGKPTMDAVFLGDGCQSAGCVDQVTGFSSNVFADRPLKAYDINPPLTFPMLHDKATVNARTYDNFAACSGPGVCNSNGAVVSGSGSDFFITHAARVLAATTDDARHSCSNLGICTTSTQNLLPLLGSGAWTDGTASWSAIFRCTGGGAVTCNDADGVRVNASVNGSQPDGFQLEWHQGTQTLSVYRCPASQAAAPCGVPAPVTTLPAGNVASGTWRYRVSYVNGAGTEFEISPVVNVTNSTSNRQVVLSAPQGPPGTATRRLYRYNPSDNTYRRVATFPDNLALTPATDNVATASLAAQPVIPAALNDGLLSSPTIGQTLPAMVYVDGPLKICSDCNNKTFFYRGHASLLARGGAADTVASTSLATASVSVDPDFLACPQNGASGSCQATADTAAFPGKSLITLYTPGNIFMGLRSQRDFFGQFYAMGKWTTSKQTNVIGAVTARVFDMTAQVPSFWEVKMPRIPTNFPPRGQRWTVSTARWKCVGAVTSNPC